MRSLIVCVVDELFKSVRRQWPIVNYGSVPGRFCMMNAASADSMPRCCSALLLPPDGCPPYEGLPPDWRSLYCRSCALLIAHSDRPVPTAKFGAARPHRFAAARFPPCGELNAFKKFGTYRQSARYEPTSIRSTLAPGFRSRAARLDTVTASHWKRDISNLASIRRHRHSVSCAAFQGV